MCTTPGFLGELWRLSTQWVPEVLEMMFFTTAIPSAAGAPEEPVFEVQVRFRGGISGMFALRIGAAATWTLAAGFLGADEAEIGPMEAAQVACEMANMLCGSVLSRAESEGGFDLDAPLLVPTDPDEQPGENEWRYRFALDVDAVIEVSFRVEEPAGVC